jgi:DNA-binding NarL/FixJ family response regulator
MIRVLLADDHLGLLGDLRALLEPDFAVVGSVQDGDALVAAAAVLAPDVIVADIAMPGQSGIEATASILRVDPAARIVLLSVHDHPALVARGLGAGALGYVVKRDAGSELAPAIHAARAGRRYLSAGARPQAAPGGETRPV